jgi:hypothetical protein
VSSLIAAPPASLLDDVGRAVEAGQFLPLGVAGHRDDPLGAKLPGRQNAHQPDGPVADDRDYLAGAGFGGGSGEPAGAEHVGCRQQRRDQLRLGLTGSDDEGAVRVRDACLLRLGADRLRHELGMHALGLVAGPADLAGVVGNDERADDELPGLHRRDVGADLLDDADVLVSHHLVVGRLDAAVGPQVGPADAGRRQPDDRVRLLDDLRVLTLLDPDVAG